MNNRLDIRTQVYSELLLNIMQVNFFETVEVKQIKRDDLLIIHFLLLLLVNVVNLKGIGLCIPVLQAFNFKKPTHTHTHTQTVLHRDMIHLCSCFTPPTPLPLLNYSFSFSQ